jgi:hypothetical protein
MPPFHDIELSTGEYDIAPPSIFSVFDNENFELTKLLASNLCIKDILNLSSTCRTLRTVFYSGPEPTSTSSLLLRFAQRCDSTSSKAWKQQ